MFGIKTFIKDYLYIKVSSKLSNDWFIKKLMTTFQADQPGHRANIAKADMGYGWIHYGFIRQQKPKKLLCVGSRHGFIPAIMAQACKDNGFGKVDFVDAGFDSTSENHWTGVGYWLTEKGKNCFKEFKLKKHIKLFVQTTETFAKNYPKNKYDYIYVDGDHSYKGVKTDFKLFWPKLNQGGFMLFHDISVTQTLNEGEYGVWKLFEELKEKNPYIAFDYSKSGLGIIQKK
jgi:predicted O-methyltransferase YrrM